MQASGLALRSRRQSPPSALLLLLLLCVLSADCASGGGALRPRGEQMQGWFLVGCLSMILCCADKHAGTWVQFFYMQSPGCVRARHTGAAPPCCTHACLLPTVASPQHHVLCVVAVVTLCRRPCMSMRPAAPPAAALAGPVHPPTAGVATCAPAWCAMG